MTNKIKYEYQSVRTVRGTDGLVISRMQKDGRELAEQAQGTLRSTGAASALSGGGEEKGESDKSTAAASEKPSVSPIPTAAESAATEVITSQNTPEFAALLKADYCDDANWASRTGS
ncbi:hypothetical protein ABZ192_00520 [Streptomyces sp. NPDC006235]|uniref:hypothetical protein n=1 Tax=Streptomyces sp. NPDC006235 TaxID=3156736 RepID=UPI0033AA371C